MDKQKRNFCLPKVPFLLPNTDKKVKKRGKNEEKVNFDDYDSPFYRHTVYCNHLVL